jgi:hypothetical protein
MDHTLTLYDQNNCVVKIQSARFTFWRVKTWAVLMCRLSSLPNTQH